MMSVDNDSSFTKTESFVETEVDGEVVLMDIDNGKFFSLEQTGRRIWHLLDEHDSVNKLTHILTSEYDVDAEQCREQVAQLLGDFQQRNMVSVRAV